MPKSRKIAVPARASGKVGSLRERMAQGRPPTLQKQRVHTISPPLPVPAATLVEQRRALAACADWTQLHLAEWYGYHAKSVCTLDYVHWWHTAMAERDAAEIAARDAAIARNNGDVAALASGLDLDVKTIPIDTANPGRIIQLDALAMARRIEAAKAQRTKGPRNHASANRHLAFHCPICSTYNEKRGQWSNTVRASNPDRLIICAGTIDRPHDAVPMQFDHSSQPDYRLQDQAAQGALGEHIDNTAGQAYGAQRGTQSEIQLAARKTKRSEIVNASDITQNNPAPRDDDIPF